MPHDGSDHASRALNWYFENMKRDGDNLIFINIVEPVCVTPAFGMTMEMPVFPDMTRVMEEHVHKGKLVCQNCLNEAEKLGLKAQSFIHIETKPGHAISKAIEDHKANIVIMGNRGLGKISRTFLGSVSDYVLHHAKIPVIIVPPKNA